MPPIQVTLCSMYPALVEQQTIIIENPPGTTSGLIAYVERLEDLDVGKPFYIRHVRDEHGGCPSCGKLVSGRSGHDSGCDMPTAGEFAVELPRGLAPAGRSPEYL
jgi:hypothetical protein